MAVVVGVHGIAQQNSTRERQFQLWSDAFCRGLKLAEYPVEKAPTLEVPFYGWLFRKGSAFLGEAAEPWDESEVSFVADALDEFIRDMSDADLREVELTGRLLGVPGILPPQILRGLAAIDRMWGVGRGLLCIGELRQVHAYLYRVGAGDVIRQLVTNRIDEDTRVLVGHSLGSVIVYDLLRRGGATQISTLITLGSPLPLATVQSALPPEGALGDHVSWFNIYDPRDPVTGGLGLAPKAHDIEVANRPSDPHTLIDYLGRKETANVILGGATR